MAHYLAERIRWAQEESDANKKRQAERECCELILRLWEKRDILPPEARPLGRIEKVLGAITSMQDNAKVLSRAICEDDEGKESPWLKYAAEAWAAGRLASDIALITTMVESSFSQEKRWIDDNDAMLDEKERSLIKALVRWLTLVEQSIDLKQVSSLEQLAPVEREGVIVEKIESLTARHQSALLHLKEELANRRDSTQKPRARRR